MSDDDFAAWAGRGRELAADHGANLWKLGEWWTAGRRWSRERTALVDRPDWPGPNAARMRTIAYVFRRMQKSSFQKDVSFTHHEVLASLPFAIAANFLDKSKNERWSVEALKAAVASFRESQTPPIESNVVERAITGRKYKAAYVDPPWGFDHPAVRSAIQRHFKVLSIDDIRNLPVSSFMMNNSYLFLWAPNALLVEALEVMRAWGYEYKGNLVWIKTRRRLGTGNYWRNAHELLLLGVRGRAGQFVDKTLVSYLQAPPGRHSEKPDEVRAMIERAVPGPYVELFARSRRPGWDTLWSDDLEFSEDFVAD